MGSWSKFFKGFLQKSLANFTEITFKIQNWTRSKFGTITQWVGVTKNILRIFFHFVIIPLMLPALLIFLIYMLICYSFAHLLICLAEHITTLSSFLLLSKIQYLKNLYVKQSIESFSISLFLASEDLPAHLCSVRLWAPPAGWVWFSPLRYRLRCYSSCALCGPSLDSLMWAPLAVSSSASEHTAGIFWQEVTSCYEEWEWPSTPGRSGYEGRRRRQGMVGCRTPILTSATSICEDGAWCPWSMGWAGWAIVWRYGTCSPNIWLSRFVFIVSTCGPDGLSAVFPVRDGQLRCCASFFVA